MHRSVIILLLTVVLAGTDAYATHIVGGVMNYRYLSGNTYSVTLRVYRDAVNAQAEFDGNPCFSTGDGAIIAVYDEFGSYVSQIELCNPTITFVTPPSGCLIIPPDVVVEEGVYNGTVTLPGSGMGYHLVYQRCCRNNTISNLVMPWDEGATYTAYIPPTSPNQNSNPVYDDYPPLFICVNDQLNFDHSAFDIDGDSLVYDLCTPFHGASQGNPKPNPPTGPPFTHVVWLNPYHTNDPLGGVPLSINPQTGMLTGTPNMIGQFVVGICVKEYRNGVLLSTTIRDFQFNVVNCQAPIARIPTTGVDTATGIGIFYVGCTDFQVQFINHSFNATSYYWDFGDPTTVNDNSTLFQPAYTYPDTGTYTVTLIANNNLGCADTFVAEVLLYPVFRADFEFRDVCQDSAVAFTDRSFSTHGVVNSWVWRFGDGTTSHQPNPQKKFNAPGQYLVQLNTRSSKGCNDTTAKMVVIHPQPDASFDTGMACLGDTVHFTNTSTVASGTITDYRWDFGAGGITNSTNTSKFYASPGTYPVVLMANTDKGCLDTFIRNIVIYPLAVTAGNLSTCAGEPLTLDVTPGYQYHWMPEVLVDDPFVQNPVTILNNHTSFTVEATDPNGCKNADTLFVFVNPPPQADAGIDTSVCLGNNDSVQLAGSGGISYSWSPSTGLNCTNCRSPMASPVDTTLYIVTVTDTNGCQANDSVLVDVLNPALNPIVPDSAELCSGDTVQIAAFGGSAYQWRPAQDISDASAQMPFFFPKSSRNYIVGVSNYCYTKEDTVFVQVNPLPVVDAGPDKNICIGDQVQLEGKATATAISWSPASLLNNPGILTPVTAPDTTTTYYLTVTDIKGCPGGDSTTVHVFVPPDTYAGGDTTICRNNSIQLSATGAANFNWRPQNNISCVNCPQPVVSPLDTIDYIVTAWDIPGCERSDTVRVNVLHPVNANSAPFREMCVGDTIQLNANGGFEYSWSPPVDIIRQDGESVWVSPKENVTYEVTVSNGCSGFEDKVQVNITVHELPDVNAGDDVKIRRDETVPLSAFGADEYLWSPEEGLSSPFVASPDASPFNTTTYTVVGTDVFGCKNIDSVTVEVEVVNLLAVPTAFSPNGDGYNDKFRIVEYLNVEKLISFKIFNRWGEQVFETTDIDKGWDGLYKGHEQEIGVYVFMIEARNRDGETYLKNGNLTLVR